jgi:WD40 repeat protein
VSDDGTARVWQAESGEAIAVLAVPESFVTSAAFSPDGQRVVTASDDGTARVWDLQGRQLAIYEGSPAALSPDGRRIAAVVDGRIKVYDVNTLPELITWGCQWLHNYLEYGKATDADRALCNLPPRPAETDPAGPFESSLGRTLGLLGVSWPERG